MPTHLVNLDALIRREDFEAQADKPQARSRRVAELRIDDLEANRPIFQLLRKPDFQRETANWEPEKVADFVRSALDGDLIPATIMWWSSLTGTVFVIDGAHRLSALMAWVHDDYGDGSISKEFFGHSIPAPQKRLAKETRELIEREIGAYQRLKYIVGHEAESPNPTMLRRARAIGTFKIDLQWVEGNAETAEHSFFKINGNATIIDRTEIGILKARRKPNAIATRALMRAGSGHKYWSHFQDKSAIERIETLARDIYDVLFKPILETPIRTTDLPIGGQSYSADAFKMIFDFVNMVNEVTPAMWQEEKPTKKRKPKPVEKLEDDPDGSLTISFLQNVQRAARLISDADYSGSLGLHPVVYFYGSTGRFQPTAFLATVKFVQEIRKADQFFAFTEVRAKFEEFLVRHRHFVNQLGHTYGSRTRPLEALLAMYRIVMAQLQRNLEATDASIVQKLLEEPRLKDLKAVTKEENTQWRQRFSRDEKSAAFLRESIDKPVRCAICHARLHSKAITTDHAVRIADGGQGDVDNAQLAHPYCNSGFKERLRSLNGGS